MVKRDYQMPRSTQLGITVSGSLLERLDRHLAEVGEPNRSAWIRAAIRARLSMEEGELRDE